MNSLTGRELLTEAYEILTKNAKQIKLKACAEIADDSDYHRSAKGYMMYEKVSLIYFSNGKNWCIGNGKAYGRYPAERYDSDILALKTKDNIGEIVKSIEASTYFENSLIYAVADGNLCLGTRFNNAMLERLRPNIGKYIAQKPEYDRQMLLLSTLEPVVKKPIKYKESFAKFIAESIEQVLKRGD